MTTTTTTEPARLTRTARGPVGHESDKTARGLCYMNCGLEVQIEGHRITKVQAHCQSLSCALSSDKTSRGTGS
jgi:hypothetical protein